MGTTGTNTSLNEIPFHWLPVDWDMNQITYEYCQVASSQLNKSFANLRLSVFRVCPAKLMFDHIWPSIGNHYTWPHFTCSLTPPIVNSPSKQTLNSSWPWKCWSGLLHQPGFNWIPTDCQTWMHLIRNIWWYMVYIVIYRFYQFISGICILLKNKKNWNHQAVHDPLTAYLREGCSQ